MVQRLSILLTSWLVHAYRALRYQITKHTDHCQRFLTTHKNHHPQPQPRKATVTNHKSINDRGANQPVTSTNTTPIEKETALAFALYTSANPNPIGLSYANLEKATAHHLDRYDMLYSI